MSTSRPASATPICACRRKRRGGDEEAAGEAVEEEAGETAETVTLTPERFAELEAQEEFILTVTAKGFGKRTSAYEYRITGRGGQGIANIEMSDRNGQVVASFPVGRARPDHAGDRRRPAHPLPGDGHPHRRPQDPGRDAVQGRGGRARGLGRPPQRRGEGNGDETAPEGAATAPNGAEGTAATAPRERHMATARSGIYPGTFDPITNGHMDIIRRATRVVDHLIVAVARNAGKDPLFALDERVELVRAEIADLNNPADGRKVEVRPFDNLLMHFAESVGACMIVRGLRAVSDFEYEFQMAGMNARLDPDVETVFLMASETPPVHLLALRQGDRAARRRHLLLRLAARRRRIAQRFAAERERRRPRQGAGADAGRFGVRNGV